MTLARTLLAMALAFSGLSTPASAQAPTAEAPAKTRYLTGVTAEQADALIAKLQDLQAKMKSGGKLYFHLLSGAPASYEKTHVPPREAFLSVPFETARWIERVPTDNRLWRPYRLTIQAKPGGLLWDVEVVLGMQDRVERVEMFYRAPHPY